MTQEALATVVHAFVTFCICYYNSLLYGISDYNINRLQRIQNSAARIVANTREYDHITRILQKLQWLPVRQRIHFNIMLITYKSINDTAPEYLCELVSFRIIHNTQVIQSDTIAGTSVSAQIIWRLCV